jgi:CheY-like chemotaxis protein
MKRIAIVEDNADNRLLLQAILRSQYVLDEYVDGTAALEGIRAQPPELVLLDISLPGMDGVAVLEALRTEPGLAHVPVVALTAHAMAGDRQRYLALGFDAYVTKPIVDETVLLRVIEDLLPPAEA